LGVARDGDVAAGIGPRRAEARETVGGGDFFEGGFVEREIGDGVGEDFAVVEAGDEAGGELAGATGGRGFDRLLEGVDEVGSDLAQLCGGETMG
jgi:hypothetical protein